MYYGVWVYIGGVWIPCGLFAMKGAAEVRAQHVAMSQFQTAVAPFRKKEKR